MWCDTLRLHCEQTLSAAFDSAEPIAGIDVFRLDFPASSTQIRTASCCREAALLKREAALLKYDPPPFSGPVVPRRIAQIRKLRQAHMDAVLCEAISDKNRHTSPRSSNRLFGLR